MPYRRTGRQRAARKIQDNLKENDMTRKPDPEFDRDVAKMKEEMIANFKKIIVLPDGDKTTLDGAANVLAEVAINAAIRRGWSPEQMIEAFGYAINGAWQRRKGD